MDAILTRTESYAMKCVYCNFFKSNDLNTFGCFALSRHPMIDVRFAARLRCCCQTESNREK